MNTEIKDIKKTMKNNIFMPLCLILLLATSTACSHDSQTTPRAETTAPGQTQAQQQLAMANPHSVAGATTAQQRPVFQSIPPKQAMRMIRTRKNLLLLDVRNPDELRNGAIAGSTLLPFWNIMRGQIHIAKQQPILLICAVGGRSYAAGQLLARKGYKEVYSLSGGIDAWKKQGLPVQYQ